VTDAPDRLTTLLAKLGTTDKVGLEIGPAFVALDAMTARPSIGTKPMIEIGKAKRADGDPRFSHKSTDEATSFA
jgi:hypothetical protein